MDETSFAAKKKSKVLTAQDRLPLVSEEETGPHITALITISASGRSLKPLFILQQRKTPLGYAELEEHCHFLSTESGWINHFGFWLFALFFVTELQHYRTSLPQQIRNQRALLILDGHKSRECLPAIQYLASQTVSVLILPGHCSHVLQLFGVGVASALKVTYKKALSLSSWTSRDHSTKDNSEPSRSQAAEIALRIHQCHPTDDDHCQHSDGIPESRALSFE